ncbi:RlpA-like double-psi beta-barrel-protein domain-containing protein-containing protein [Lentinula lateritia]|uniref:RlpA-like double-psi beta-barrel-protein domain-containing protein-containing protein n=1 Tax=Lentinula aff. lateritia TaxID=2804960 RepID=A0ACC1TN33_9AGAR|nr:RlpA-like double-psi beta-barrel-protein domain-containing protein-containing protein [Lentinula aff. lateritia]KAJ3849011.1 RlpA-like double-psi beta-barrel-protein domain-containing protein-containing protein [Lentinula lateritia]
MSSFTSVTRIALLIQAVLLIVSIAFPVHAGVVPVHHVLRRDNGPHHGDFRGGFNAGHGNGASATDASSSVTDDTSATVDPATATTTEVAATSTDIAAAATTTTSTTSSSGTTYTGGYATYFYQEGVAGACGTVHSDSDLIVAVDEDMYSSDLCGKTVVITNVASGATVTATVADECPGCATSTSLDLSVAAFEALSDLSVGTFAITWVLED